MIILQLRVSDIFESDLFRLIRASVKSNPVYFYVFTLKYVSNLPSNPFVVSHILVCS